MSIEVRSNMSAMNARQHISTIRDVGNVREKLLSDDFKINRSADDDSALAISDKMRSQIRDLDKAQDGIGVVQIAEGAMEQVHSLLQRMNELSVKAANGTTEDSTKMSSDVKAINEEIDRVNDRAEGTAQVLLGTAEGTANDQIEVKLSDSSELTAENAQYSMSGVDNAEPDVVAGKIDEIDSQRAETGPIQNRLDPTIKTAENTQTAEATIRDTDTGTENFTNNERALKMVQDMLALQNQPNQGEVGVAE